MLLTRSCPLPLSSLHARRFVQYAPMANECYILMLIYLDRISQTNSAFCITALNAHRMIVTGLVLVCAPASWRSPEYSPCCAPRTW